MRIKNQRGYYLDMRETIRRASGENLDLKAYEADMRHLIDTYIEADAARPISNFADVGLLDVIVHRGIDAAVGSLPEGVKRNRDAVAETIENNIRRTIIRDQLNDPAFYEKMSSLLDEIIADRKAKAIDYEMHLRQVAELAQRVVSGQADDTPAEIKHSPGMRALYNNLRQPAPDAAQQTPKIAEQPEAYNVPPRSALQLAKEIDAAVREFAPDDWRDVQARELTIKQALYALLNDEGEVHRIFQVIKAQSEY